jgi:hypothetical protein
MFYCDNKRFIFGERVISHYFKRGYFVNAKQVKEIIITDNFCEAIAYQKCDSFDIILGNL